MVSLDDELGDERELVTHAGAIVDTAAARLAGEATAAYYNALADASARRPRDLRLRRDERLELTELYLEHYLESTTPEVDG